MTDITYDRTEDVTHQWTRVDIRASQLSLPTGYDHPIVLAAMQTFNGSDTAQTRMRSLRECGFDVKVEEETSRDSEVNHIEETIGHIAFPPSWIRDNSGAIIGHAAFLDASQEDADTWIPLPVPSLFSPTDSVAFLQVLTFNGTQPVHARLRKVDCSPGSPGFQFKLEEWPTYDNRHAMERLGMVVLRRGYHALGSASDPHLMVGQITNVRTGWKPVNLGGTTGAGRPVLVSQCQTFNGSDPVVTRQRETGPLGAQLRLQEAEIGGAHPNAEIVGYVAVGIP